MNYIQEKKQEGFTPTPISIGMSSHSERGFTLVETLVAITVLLIAIVAPLSIVANSINATYAARDQMTAVYLASEAIEIIRQKRDTNVMQGGTASWDDGFGTGECDLGSTNACSVSILDMGNGNLLSSPEIRKCTGGFGNCSDYKIRQNNDGLYGGAEDSASWDNPTQFTRTVETQKIGDSYIVTVTVEWTKGSRLQTTIITDLITERPIIP